MAGFWSEQKEVIININIQKNQDLSRFLEKEAMSLLLGLKIAS